MLVSAIIPTLKGIIITIEDPIEFVHPHKGCLITQREVGVDAANCRSIMKSTLRQAPDVILLGEIRDREAMDYAVAYAETGHLCLSARMVPAKRLTGLLTFFQRNAVTS